MVTVLIAAVERAFWGGLAAAGFAVILNVPKRALLACALTGVLGHVTRTLSIPFTGPAAASFLAAFAVSLFGKYCGRRVRAPAVVFVIPGIIPLIPGSLAFRAIIDTVSVINTTGTAQRTALLAAALGAVRIALVTAALAIGVAVPSIVLRRERPML